MTLADAAGWVAPAATMIAAMMTAANLGARVTGWGFVVFTLGSIGWTTVAIATGQQNLLLTNGFLTLVNVVGIWRWLGREARYRDDAETVAAASRAAPVATVLPAGQLLGRAITGADGSSVATVVDAMVACPEGRLQGLLVRHGGVAGVGERVVLLAPEQFALTEGGVSTALDRAALAALPEVVPAAA